MRPINWQKTKAILWLLWAALLPAAYYGQVWRLLTMEPLAWARDQYSLVEFLVGIRHLVWGGAAAWQFPAAGPAAARLAWAGFGLAAVLLAALALGRWGRRLLRWQPENWQEALLFETALGLGALSYLLLALAGLGFYTPGAVRLVVGLLAMAGLVQAAQLVKKRGLPALLPRPAPAPVDRLWQAIALVALLFALMGALAPEIEYDAVWYHLWLPQKWLEQGGPVDIVWEFISLYPLTWELLFGAGLALGGPVAAKLLHFICLPLLAVLVFRFTRRYFSPASPWLAAALFVTIPTVLWEATTAYVDLALTFHVGLTLYALLRYVDTRRRAWFVMAVVNLGLATATKHLGLFVLAFATTGLFIRLWLAEKNFWRAFLPPLLLGLISLLFPLPWYVRAWLASGNPVFPDFYSLFGAFPPERWSEASERSWRLFEAQFGRPRTLVNQLRLVWDVTVHPAWYDGALGPLFLLLLPGLAVRRRVQWAGWLLAFVLAYMALWSAPFNGLELRFLIPLTPFLAILAAEAVFRLGHIVPARLLTALLAGLMVLNLPPFMSLHENDRVMWEGWLTHVLRQPPLAVVVGMESEHDYLARHIPAYPAWQYINTHVPASARILTFNSGDHLYSRRARLWSEATLALPATWWAEVGQEQAMLAALRRLQISHVLINRQQIQQEPWSRLALTQPAVLRHWFEPEYQDATFILYRLRPEPLPALVQDTSP